MAALLPFIQDLLPMIMPSSIHITKASDIALPSLPGEVPEGADEGAVASVPRRVVSRDAIVNKTSQMCATVMFARPKSYSAVHHHGEQDTIIYVTMGSGYLLTSPKGDDVEPTRHPLAKGDFAVVPAWTEHQALNESDDEDLVWVVIRSGPTPVEVNLTGWAGAEAKDSPRS